MKARTVTIFSRFGMRRGANRVSSGRRLAVPLAMIAAALSLLFAASPAFATRLYQSQITMPNSPVRVAVDSSDNLWAVANDGTDSTVGKFDSSGTSLATYDGTGSWKSSAYVLDVAWGKTAGLIYASDSNLDDIWGLNANATYAGIDLPTSLGGCCFINAAVDNSGGAHDGSIYVGSSDGTVTRIHPDGSADDFSALAPYISGAQLQGTLDHNFSISGTATSSITDVTVDAGGDIYVLDAGTGSTTGNHEIDRFHSSGEFVRAYTGPSGVEPQSVAVDPTTGKVLMGDAHSGYVIEFDSAGNLLGEFNGSTSPKGSFLPQSLAVDSTGRLYIGDGQRPYVTVYGPSEGTLEVSRTGTGSGEVVSSPAGIACGSTCSAQFAEGELVELTATASPGSTFTGWSGACAGSGACSVTMGSAEKTVKATFAQDKPTVVTTAGATAIAQHAATVAGTVNPNSGKVTNCHIDYGTTEAYGSQVLCSAKPGGGSTPVGVSAALSGLSAATTYHFRVVATNAGGTANGNDQTFATLADTCATDAALCPPPVIAPPVLTPPAAPLVKKPLTCKKGFKKHKVHGRFVCKKIKHKKHHKK